jgi:hypothetical protein
MNDSYFKYRWVPVDAAFTSLNLASYTTEQLKAILLYHLTPRVAYSTQLNPGDLPTNLQGQTLSLQVGQEGVSINGATVVLADTFTTAGIIHVINKVLIPNSFPATVSVPTPTSTVVAATQSARPVPSPSMSTTSNKNNGYKMEGSLAMLSLLSVFFV